MWKGQKTLSTEAYLKKENNELKLQIAELKQLLEYNKNALRVSINYSKKGEMDDKPYQKLINQLYFQNDRLRTLLNKKQGEYNEANSMILLGQKMVEASQDYEKTVVEDLKDKIDQLRQDLKEKEERVAELQKQKPQIDQDNMMQVRIVEITHPQTMMIKMHDDLETLKQQLVKKDQEIAKEKQAKEDLCRLNLALTKQINELKSYHCQKSTNSKEPPSRGGRDLNYFLECQQKIYDEDESISDRSMSQPDSESDRQKNKKKPGKAIPKLQLRKAKEIQQIIVKKINLDEKKKSKNTESATKQDEALRKKINFEVLRNLQLTRTIDKLTRVLKETEQRNKLLLKAHNKSTNKSNPFQASYIGNASQQQEEPSFMQKLLLLGKDIYLNENIDAIINGDIQVTTRHRSASLDLPPRSQLQQ